MTIKTYTIKLTEQQVRLVKDAIDHQFEVDLDYLEYDNLDKEELELLYNMFQSGLVDSDQGTNSVGI